MKIKPISKINEDIEVMNKNLHKVDDSMVSIDTVYADAIKDNEKAEKNLRDIEKEKEKEADAIKLPKPSEKAIENKPKLSEDWFDDEEEDSDYEYVRRKMVYDSDGFTTDYTWYRDSNGNNVFVFGDSDLYRPEDGEFDFETESDEQAEEWFNSYEGLLDDYDIDEDMDEREVIITEENCEDCYDSLKESVAGEYSEALWDMIDDGAFDTKELCKSFIRYMSEEDVKDFCHANDIDIHYEEEE